MRKILAFDIGGTFIKYGIITEKGEIIEQYQSPTEASKGGQELMKKIVALARNILESEKDISGIGISTGGQISPKTGEVLWATDILPGWMGIKIKEILQHEFSLPVFVDNDANAAALGEKWIGAAKEAENFLLLIIGTGLGGAIVLNNKVYRGNRGSAGEMGHIIIEREGLVCSCGGKGCLESYASFSGIINYVKERASEYRDSNIDAKTIFEKAEYDVICKEAVEWFACNLGLGISNLLHIFNPSLIIIAGNLVEEGEAMLERIKASIKSYTKKHAMPSFMEGLEIKFAECGNNAGILGAAFGVLSMEE
ncbi:MAG: ROK family protein [Deltaproteobacteria bacterium]